jgi:hypothetical protein
VLQFWKLVPTSEGSENLTQHFRKKLAFLISLRGSLYRK